MTHATSYVHGGTDAREVARLEKQGGWTAELTFKSFDAAKGMRVLDLATGVGAMASRLTRAFEGIELVGVDLSPQQLSAARKNHPSLKLVRADACQLPFADQTFDRVYCSWLLEHVPSPTAVLREVRRVLRPGGYCQFIEVDNSTFGTTPDFAEVNQVLFALNRAQQRVGGDPMVGQRLHRYFRAAAFRRFELEPCRLRGHAGDPVFFQKFIDEFAEIFEGLDESLGPAMMPVIATAASQLRSLLHLPEGEMRYCTVIAKGFR